ncbi:MAG: hypothetical protein WCK35_16560 [Chloroflexota bacterium]
MPGSAVCQPQVGAEGISVVGQDGEYIVCVDPSVTRAELQLIRFLGGQVISVPLFIPIPRLEWRLILGDEQAVVWTTQPIKRSVDHFLQVAQSTQVNLLIRLHNIEEIASLLVVYLVDSNHPERTLQNDFKLERSLLGNGHARFSLNASDTLKGHPEISVFEFQLGIPVTANWIEKRFSLLTLTRALEIFDVHMESANDSKTLLWEEPRLLSNRRLFIRSAWQPWGKEWDIKIPDSVRGEFEFLSAGFSLPPSRYEIYFYVAAEWEPDSVTPPHQKCEIIDTVDPKTHLAWLEEQILVDPAHVFRWIFESACVWDSLGNSVERITAIDLCFAKLDQANLTYLQSFHDWVGKYDHSTQKAVHMKMYRVDRLKQLFSETKFADPFRHSYLQNITSLKSISSRAALLLVRNTDDPLIVMHSLRSLIKAHSVEGVDSIADLLNKRKLTDADAADLLAIEMDFSFNILAENDSTPEHLHLFSVLIKQNIEKIGLAQKLSNDVSKTVARENKKIDGLLHGSLPNIGIINGNDATPKLAVDISMLIDDHENFNAMMARLSNQRLIALTEVEENVTTKKSYIARLIQNSDPHGIQMVMHLFQKELLLDHEVFELLSENPKFSHDFLNNAPRIQPHLAQVTGLAEKYPIETGHIKAGMYILTPVGWGKIKSIEDMNQNKLVVAHESDQGIHLILSLNPDEHPVQAKLNLGQKTLTLLGSQSFVQCTKCNIVSINADFITKKHNRKAHFGIGASMRTIAPQIPMRGELKFTTSLEN